MEYPVIKKMLETLRAKIFLSVKCMSKEKLIKQLVKVIRRLSCDQTRLLFAYDRFSSIIKKLEGKKGSTFSKKEKQIISEYLSEYKYYQGKVMAYSWVLVQMVGVKKANRMVFKGFEGEKNIDKYGKKIKRYARKSRKK